MSVLLQIQAKDKSEPITVELIGKRVRCSTHEYHLKVNGSRKVVVRSVSALSNSQVLAAAQAQMATDVQARDGAQDDAPETLEGLDRLQTISQLQELRDRVLDPVLTFRLDRLLDSLRPDA